MSPAEERSRKRIDTARREIVSLTEAGTQAIRSGNHSEARRCFQRAERIASRNRLRDDEDKARLNLAMVRLERGEVKEAEEGLREILLRSPDPRVQFTAAYHLASSLRRRGRHESASRYAARALERAESIGDPDILAPVQGLLGNLLMARSYPGDAIGCYETALRLRESQESDTRWSQAILLDNIGYCLLLERKFDAGLEKIHQALLLAEEVGDCRCVAECRQDLCYGYLLRDDLERALDHGSEALDEAIAGDYSDVVENCHYLLGEVASRTGDHQGRDRHFQALQERHPEIPFLKDFLCTVDVTGIITLKR